VNALLDRFRATSPEAAARGRFAFWALAVLVVLLPLWWIRGADLAAAALRPLAGLVMGLFGLTGVIEVLPEGDWSVGTRLTASGQPVTYTVSQDVLRRLLLGVPLVAAFLIAPPRPTRPLRAALISVAVMAVLFTLTLTGLVWGQLVPQLDPTLASSAAQSTLRLDQPPLHPIASQIALMTRYMGLSIAPLVSAAVLWAVLSPDAFRALAGEIHKM
jgi:hypothetical protein